jgi:hypothetical protein
MTSEDTVWQISSAIIAAMFPPKTWCEEATNNDLDKALFRVLNSEGEAKISHIKGLNKLDEVLATLAKEAKLAYFTEGDK